MKFKKAALVTALTTSLLFQSLSCIGAAPQTASDSGRGVIYQDEKTVESNSNQFTADDNGQFVEGQAIVAFSRRLKQNGISQTEEEQIESSLEKNRDIETADILADVSKTVIGEDEDCLITLICSNTLSTEQIIETMEKREDVLYAEPNYIGETASTDHTDLQYNAVGDYSIEVEKWNTYDDGGHPTPAVDAGDVVVAVVDSGVDDKNEDLKNVMWDQGLDYPSLKNIGGGRYGINVCNTNTHGYDYDSTNTQDDFHHGTHVAGIIAAEWNGIGVSGLSGGAKIMAVKSMNNIGYNTIVESIKAYDYIIKARQEGVNVRVINNSWHDNVFGHTMDLLVRQAGKLGILSVFAAGNRTIEIDNKDFLAMSFYKNPYAIIVGGTDENGESGDYSNYSKKAVDVFAPGTRVYSTVPRFKGTVSENALPFEKDGIVYEIDSSKDDITVENNHISGNIGFSGSKEEGKETGLTVKNIEGSGKYICVTEKNEKQEQYICSDLMKGAGDCIGGYIDLYVEEDGTDVFLTCYNPDYHASDGENKEYYGLSHGLNRLPFSLFEHVFSDDLSFQMGIMVMKNNEMIDHVYIKKIVLTGDVDAYGYDSGTSMATPAVAAEAATLFANFEDEEADKIAARIIGSVNQRECLSDQCLSGGIVSTKKALAGDTCPVIHECRIAGDKIEALGYFFGEESGSVSIDGKPAQFETWSDTIITISVPTDFAAGEHVIEVVSSDKKAGHRYEYLGQITKLAKRLPLPGRSLAGDPGIYTVTSDEFDAAFYGIEMQSLVGYDDCLYAISQSEDLKTTIFCYDIQKQTWSQVYHGDYTADSGACTWKNKILFFANDEGKEKHYLGVFDPKTKTADYYLQNDTYCEKYKTMVNTGGGVFSAGGSYEHTKPHSDGEFLFGVSRLNEETMKFEELKKAGEDNPIIVANSICIGYSGPNELWLYGGNDGTSDTNSVYHVTISGNICQIKKINDDAPITKNAAFEQGAAMQGVSLADGMMFSGRVSEDENSRVSADTFFAAYGKTVFDPVDVLISRTPVYSAEVTAYKNNYYVLGATYSENGGHVFATFPVKTKPQYGDKATVKASSTAGGKLDREGSFETYIGAKEVFRPIADDGYVLSGILIDGEALSAEKLADANKNGIVVEMLLPDQEIAAEFTKKETKPSDADQKETKDTGSNGHSDQTKAYTDAGAGVGKISADGKTLIDPQGKKWQISKMVKAADIKKNACIAVKGKGKYKITKVTKKKGKITAACATFMAPYDLNAKTLTIPKSVKIAGITIRVSKMQTGALQKCKKLKDLRFRITDLANFKFGKNALKGVSEKCVVKVPGKQLSKYKTRLKKVGLSKKVRIKKLK